MCLPYAPLASIVSSKPISFRPWLLSVACNVWIVSPFQPSVLVAVPATVHPPAALEPASTSTSPRASVIALLRERLARQDAEFVKLDETFLAHKDRVLELKSSVAKSTTSEANLCSQVSTLQADLVAACTELTASQSSVATATSELDKLWANIKRSTIKVLDSTFTADGLRFQHSDLQSSIFLAALDSLHGRRDHFFLGLLQSLAGQIDRSESDFTTLLTRVRDSRSSFHRGAGPLLKKFHATLN